MTQPTSTSSAHANSLQWCHGDPGAHLPQTKLGVEVKALDLLNQFCYWQLEAWALQGQAILSGEINK